ncbi:unnamed protein product, partial [Prorocentrum cordatum]
VRAAVTKVLTEMGRSDGIYFEQKVNTKGDGRFYQLELEVDGSECAQGGRFVWFNSRLQKVVEIGLSDDKIGMFMPPDLYQKSREWASAIAREGGNNTRATMEGLVFKNEKGEFEMQFIECNRRPQVENEALDAFGATPGNRRYTFCELMMRAKGYPAPQFQDADNCKVVLHARWLHGNPDHMGNITYQAGKILGMTGPRLDYVAAELMAPGEISFTSDPQLGKSVIIADSWEHMCDRAVEYFSLRRPTCQGSSSTYAQAMCNLFSNKKFRDGEIASNETFKYLDIPEHPTRGILNILEDQVSPVLVRGYRPGEGIDKDRFPTPTVSARIETLHKELMDNQVPNATPYTQFARGEIGYEDYVKSLRGQLATQGGGWVTVAPRDTAQQGNDSESASLTSISRRNAEVWAEKAGCVGYEIGGAQYQAGLIRGFDPAMIMVLGLPYNMPAHSLQRSQYVNGLMELPTEIRQPLFEHTAELVASHYRPGVGVGGKLVPWAPYNFHAGNFYDAKTGYSPQDETTAELLKAKCLPMPNWVFSAKFPLEEPGRLEGAPYGAAAAPGLSAQGPEPSESATRWRAPEILAPALRRRPAHPTTPRPTACRRVRGPQAARTWAGGSAAACCPAAARAPPQRCPGAGDQPPPRLITATRQRRTPPTTRHPRPASSSSSGLWRWALGAAPPSGGGGGRGVPDCGGREPSRAPPRHFPARRHERPAGAARAEDARCSRFEDRWVSLPPPSPKARLPGADLAPAARLAAQGLQSRFWLDDRWASLQPGAGARAAGAGSGAAAGARPAAPSGRACEGAR